MFNGAEAAVLLIDVLNQLGQNKFGEQFLLNVIIGKEPT